MIRPGLVSVTFRSLSWERVLALTVEARLEGIEWGGDVHAPPGDLARAEAIARESATHGVAVVCYGSYYRFGECMDAPGPSFDAVLATAVALGAPVLRVWAGHKGSARVSTQERQAVVEQAKRCADMAARHNCRIAFEYHGNTLTDTVESALSLVGAIDHPNVSLLWQPAVGRAVMERETELVRVLPFLAHVHCFHWGPAGFTDKRPLAEGAPEWRRYLRAIPADQSTWALLEFLPELDSDNGSPGEELEILQREAATLRGLVSTKS